VTCTPRYSLDQRAAHIESLLALSRLVVTVQRPGVARSWFVLMVDDAVGGLTIVRVDA